MACGLWMNLPHEASGVLVEAEELCAFSGHDKMVPSLGLRTDVPKGGACDSLFKMDGL